MALKLWHHVHVVNPEWHDAAPWYAEHSPLGRVAWEHPGHQGYRSEILRSGPNIVLMMQAQHADAPATAAIESLGIAVPDLVEALESFTAGGGHVQSRDDRSARVTDPWGMRLEFLQSGQGDAALSHVNIVAEDPQMLCDWYQRHLGGQSRTCDFDDTRIALAYDTCELLFRQADAAPPDHRAGYRHYDHLGWLVEDIHRTCDELMAGGVDFPGHASRGAANPPQPGDGRMIAFASDPCGIWFELVNVIPENAHRAKIGRWEG